MESITEIVEPAVIVIFGASGDLTWRKLIPAFYNLYLDKWIDGNFAVIGVSNDQYSDAGYRKHLMEGVNKNSRRGRSKKKKIGMPSHRNLPIIKVNSRILPCIPG
jgi:glucose-6-phosphate 1-dehydrogenase